MAPEIKLPMVRVLKGHFEDRPRSFFPIYRLHVGYEQLLVINDAAVLYSEFFCSKFSKIPSMLRTIGQRIDVTSEVEFLRNLKIALTPELSSTESYEIYDPSVRALTKMAHDIQAAIINYLSQGRTTKSGANTSIRPASSEIVPEINTEKGASNNIYYTVDLTDRLFFTLAKSLYLYEAILSGNFSLMLELARTNGVNESRITILKKVLDTFQQSHYNGLVPSNPSERAEVAAYLRTFIEHNHPDLKGVAGTQLLPEECDNVYQEDTDTQEYDEIVIRPRDTTYAYDDPIIKQYMPTHESAVKSWLLFLSRGPKWYTAVAIGVCVLFVSVSSSAIYMCSKYYLDIGHHSATDANINQYATNKRSTSAYAHLANLDALQQLANRASTMESKTPLPGVPGTSSDQMASIKAVMETQTPSEYDNDQPVNLNSANGGLTISDNPKDGSDYSSLVSKLQAAPVNSDAAKQLASELTSTKGDNGRKDDQESVKLLQKGSDQGDANAQQNLGVMYELGMAMPQNYAEAARLYRKAADQGLASAQFSLGLMYREGRGVQKDDLQAVAWFKKSADQGNADAQYNLGVMNELGAGLPQNFEEAAEWYRKAADQGLASAQFSLGFMYRTGRGVQKDDLKAVGWFQKSADQGYANAQYNLGAMKELGIGLAQNYAEAAKWYAKAADQGQAMAQEKLGLMFEDGKGVERDNAKALELYEIAAGKGLASAQFFLGMMYRKGKGVTVNDAEAVKWFKKGVEKSDLLALHQLEKIYGKVKGVTQNDAETEKWFREAAVQGNAAAQFMLAQIYRDGKGVAKDDVQAVKWHQKAAAQGYIHAQEELGFMYALGQGAAQDDAAAEKWFREAAAQGYTTW